MTSSAARDSRISILALVAAGLAATALILVGVNRWFGHLVFGHGGALNVCQSISKGCEAAVLSIASVMKTPGQLVLAVVILALVFALARSAWAVFCLKRIVKDFGRPAELPRRLTQAITSIGIPADLVWVSKNDRPLAFTAGMFHQRICLSYGLIRRLAQDELEAVLAHEYAHTKRHDNIGLFFATLVRDFLFALPVVHFFYAMFTRAKEHAADDLAASLVSSPLKLASAIVSFSKLSTGVAMPTAYTGFLPSPATAESRVSRLIGDRSEVGLSLSRLAVAVVSSLLIVLLLTGSAMANPAGQNLQKNCHKGGACSFTQDHSEAQQNVCNKN